MSFLSSNNSEFLSARITQKGRNSIAKGNFNIEYFQIGDSEFDYNLIYSGLTGQTTHQRVLSPFDKETSIKYPYKIDSSTSGTTYGTPVQQSTTDTIRNVMGPAGFISEFNEFESCSTGSTNTTIKCERQSISKTSLTGETSSLQVLTGASFNNCEFITIVFDDFCSSLPILTGNSTSLIYRIESISGNTLNLDRPLPNVSSATGFTNVQVICNKCEIEYPPSESIDGCIPYPVDNLEQQNPWTLNIVWGKKPTGADVGGTNESLSGYTSNRFVSTKEFLGYTSTGQTFENLTGGTITPFSSKSIGSGFKNSLNELIEVSPKEQRCVAFIHYSELGDLINEPERFFKYDDYISYKTGTTGEDISLITDRDGDDISDTQYFEVYIPFIYYHRNTGTTYGALFYMDTIDYYVRSTKNDRHDLLFRYLIDEQGNRIGKVFPKNKIIVFDDQELVAVLDYRSNRKFTLGAPKVSAVPSNNTIADSIISGTTGQTFYITYMLSKTNGTVSPINSLPSNYYIKLSVNNTSDTTYQTVTYPSDINVKFSGDTFNFLNDSGFLTELKPERFYILIQDTTDNTDRLPNPEEWKIIDFTSQAGGSSLSGLTSTTFTITKSMFTGATFFDLETFMGSNYLLTGTTTDSQFGDEQPFPGSIRLVRASDVEQMNFLVNLPSTQFTETQNPTYSSGNKYITEVALLDSNKEVLVKSKSAIPVKRSGTQVFSIRLDF
jgi:hypothetical protein